MSTTTLPSRADTTVDAARLAEVIDQTCRAAFARVGAGGRFLAPGDSGLTSTLYAFAVFHLTGRLAELDVRGVAANIARQQLPTGAFPNYPGDPTGDPWVTALARGVLETIGDPAHVPMIEAASRFIATAGGEATVADGMYRININPLYLAMMGRLPADELPHLHGEPLLVDAVLDVARHRMNVACLWLGVAIWSILAGLRRPADRLAPSWLESAERRKALEILSQFQNPLGSFNACVMQTSIAAAALHCLGVAADDERLVRALRWLCHRQEEAPAPTGPAATFHEFHTSVWTTALFVRALLASGVSRADPFVVRSVEWLVRSQVKADLPRLVPSRPGAPRRGGWSFEAHNITVPDADDTAVVLGALGLALEGAGDDRLPEATAELVRSSVATGLEFLLGMQNADGGWPAFQQGLPSKPRGPILVRYPHFDRGHLLRELRTGAANTLLFGDPATEDITGRTLFALAQLGYTKDAPVVKEAIAFLVAQQCTHEDLGGGWEHVGGGPWWSRWITNYLSATSYVLGGLMAVGVSPNEPFVRRAIDWTLRRQNADGGWGEEPASYRDPARAGAGPSMPVTTGLVVSGLIQCGEGGSEAVRRGVRFLLDCPRDAQGMWPDLGPLHVFYRTDTFYVFTGARYYYPLEALGRYRQYIDGRAPSVAVGDVSVESLDRAAPSGDAGAAIDVRAPNGGWCAVGLEAMRRVGDPAADGVVRQLASGGALRPINDLMARIVHNDDPIPPGLPEAAATFFEETARLPDWADESLLGEASRMFERVGWATALALFNASLPQCYALANGARALVTTRGLVDAPERRVFETAQFIFDVTGKSGFEAGGLAVRAAQKVRLLHAAIRHLALKEASWDLAWGVPINQEDLVATLLSFSLLIIQAWKKMQIAFAPAEETAWLHLWKVVGHVMGVHASLLPTDIEDAQRLWDAITSAQWAPSDAGRQLTRALLSVSDRFAPHFAGASIPATMMRYFAGETCADILAVPPADWTGALIQLGRRVDGLVGDPTRGSRLFALLEAISLDLMKALVVAERAGKQTRFRIPDALIHDWNLRD